MKKFFISMLGAFTGTWLAFLLSGIFVFFVAIAMVSSLSVSVSTDIPDNSVLLLDLSGTVADKPYNKSLQELVNNPEAVDNSLQDILLAIKTASESDKIKGIVINCNNISTGWASSKAIRDALSDFKQSKKWIYAYGHSISQKDYYIASVADKVYMNPVGMLDIHGLTSRSLFFKGLFDKLGVDVQIVRVGTYKSAVEPYSQTKMSDANRLQTQTYINNIWNEFCTSVAQSRHIEASTIKQFADSLGMLSDPKLALSNKLIDQLCYEHEFESIVKENLKLKENKDISYVLPVELNNSPEYTPNVSSNKIALLVAEGDIVVEGPETSIASATLVPEIIKLANDDEVKGLVLRVNSPGGSAYASEQIWEALEFFKGKGKTLAVSMGDYAASGGYYISCGANRIFAEPNTITGSIGIFGMIPSIKGFVSGKLGVTSDVVSTTPNADLSLMEPMTPFQREAMQNNVNRGYELFTSRCAKGRNIPLDTLKSIAEGRVWDGKEALRLKLVDEFGGIDDAIQWVAKEEKIQNDYSVSLYPVFEEDLLNMIFKSVPVNAAAAQQPAQELYLQETVDRIQNILKQDKLQCRMDDIYIY